MKMHPSITRWGFPCAIIGATVFTLVAFTGAPKQNAVIVNHVQDTIPEKDLDKELRQLDKAQEQLDKIKDKDWEKMERDVQESLKKIDLEKIQQQATAAMKQADLEKINAQIQESLKKIDFDKIQRELDQSMSKIDKDQIARELDKARLQVDQALGKANWQQEFKNQKFRQEEVEKQMANAQKQLEKAREDMKHQQFNFKQNIDKAKVDIDRTKEELKSYQEMIYDMEKDGLLNTKDDYTIEYKDGDLFINDKKQPQEVTDKYKKYFKENKTTIKKENGHIKINNNHHKNTRPAD
jgi:DNA repair exonuclease SbcCD ATPase subunit